MRIRVESQQAEVAAMETALITLVRPVVQGILLNLKADVVAEAGGYSELKLKMLPRVYRPGDGDYGICFEYAVHQALLNQDERVCERVSDALKQCNVAPSRIDSILFAVEKNRNQSLIDTARDVLTDDSLLLPGPDDSPIKLRRHLDGIADAFHRATARELLPQSIYGVWKGDLFLGSNDLWVATTVKVAPWKLEGAKGLRIGIVPAQHGKDDRISLDERRNLVVCPLPYDGAFVEVFLHAWNIVQQLIAADMTMPREVNLPMPAHRQVAQQLVMRREFAVVEVLDALLPLTQPELLTTQVRAADLQVVDAAGGVKTTEVLAPAPVGLAGNP